MAGSLSFPAAGHLLAGGMLRMSSVPLTLMVAPAPGSAELAIVPPSVRTVTPGRRVTAAARMQPGDATRAPRAPRWRREPQAFRMEAASCFA